MIRKFGIIILTILFALNSTSCGSKTPSRYEAEFLRLFDTLTKIVAYMDSKEEFARYSQLIYDNLKEYHELYDIYNDYDGINNIKTINDNAGVTPVKVDRRIIELLKFSRDCYRETNGKVNIAYGSVLKLWHDYRTIGIEDYENAELPPLDKLKTAAIHTNINDMIIDESESTVFLRVPDMRLDVGAVAKGYAAEQVKQIAIKNGFISGLISVGGNVCAVGGKGESNIPWNVGIQNPNMGSEQSDIHIINIIDYSLVTSGIYERFYTVNGENYHHIIDPETLFPSLYFTAVTIICKDSGAADALSTAVFNMPFEEGLDFINGLPDTEALWVFNDGQMRYSSNFKDFIKK